MTRKIIFSILFLAASAAVSYFLVPQNIRDKALAFLKNSILIPAREITITKNTWAETQTKLFKELESNLSKIKEELTSPEIQGITETVTNIVNESQEIIETIKNEEDPKKGIIKMATEKIAGFFAGADETQPSQQTQPEENPQPSQQNNQSDQQIQYQNCPAENLKCECIK